MTKYEQMFPGHIMHFLNTDPKMKPKPIFFSTEHIRSGTCYDSENCAVHQAFEGGDYVYDELRVGWDNTYLRKGMDVFVYTTPRYRQQNGDLKSIAKEFDDAKDEHRNCEVSEGIYVFLPTKQKHTEEQRLARNAKAKKEWARGERWGRHGKSNSLRKLSMH